VSNHEGAWATGCHTLCPCRCMEMLKVAPDTKYVHLVRKSSFSSLPEATLHAHINQGDRLMHVVDGHVDDARQSGIDVKIIVTRNQCISP